MITPTVGRVVWFYPHGSDVNASPLAAIVTAVWTPTRVNLCVLSQEGVPYPTPPNHVLFVQEENQRPESGRCFATWPKREDAEVSALSLAASGDVDALVALGFGDNIRTLLGLKDFLSRIDLSGIDITLIPEIISSFQAIAAAVGTKAKIEAGLSLARLVAAATKKTEADDKFVETVGTILTGPLLDLVAAIIDRWIAQKATQKAGDVWRAASFEALTADEDAEFVAAGVDPATVMMILKMLWDFWQMWQAKK